MARIVDRLPTPERPPPWVRWTVRALAVTGLTLATITTLSSRAWIGEPFPGFVVLQNRAVASASLPHWSGAGEGILGAIVEQADGRDLPDGAAVYAAARTAAPGNTIAWGIRRPGESTREIHLQTQTFGERDWWLLFAPYLTNGLVALGGSLVAWALRPRSLTTRAFLAFGVTVGVFLLTAMDLYGPGRFTRLYLVADALLPAAGLNLALTFPEVTPIAPLRWVGFAAALGIAIGYQIEFADPDAFLGLLHVNMFGLGIVAVAWAVRLVAQALRYDAGDHRRAITTVLAGLLVGIALPGLNLALSSVGGPSLPMNASAITLLGFLIAVAFAILRQDLFHVHAIVKQGAVYLVVTGIIVVAYAALLGGLQRFLSPAAGEGRTFLSLTFVAVVLLVLDPLRSLVRRAVDRIFYGPRIDTTQVLRDLSNDLRTALRRQDIDRSVRSGLGRVYPGTSVRLFLEREGSFIEVGGTAILAAAIAVPLREGRILSAVEAREQPGNSGRGSGTEKGGSSFTADALTAMSATLAVPILTGEHLSGALILGSRTGGGLYRPDDASFLGAVASQTGIALQNVASYEALQEANLRLEERVRDRTQALERANQDLSHAYSELKQAEAQLVHSEKMASLGRLVAGVAHEINNPVSFIVSSIEPLRKRLDQLAPFATGNGTRALEEARDLTSIVARGAERTAAIVKDLRTFSRLDEARIQEFDPNEGLEITLRLVEARWKDRITFERSFGALPAVEGDPGQLNQVFMNLIVNACDAIAERGTVRVVTRADVDSVVVEVTDDGRGIRPEDRDRIFDPFFTTKAVGSGTGLGLAVSHEIVAAHGGRIEVESEFGRGSIFRVILPQRSHTVLPDQVTTSPERP